MTIRRWVRIRRRSRRRSRTRKLKMGRKRRKRRKESEEKDREQQLTQLNHNEVQEECGVRSVWNKKQTNKKMTKRKTK